jgi:hypothetical protein
MARSAAGAEGALAAAFERAVAGDARALHDVLARGSGLPGTRANLPLADAFAELARARGAAADPILVALVKLDPDAARGGTALEFLPVCGVAGLGARAAQDDTAYARGLEVLHHAADDLRFRVRAEVCRALARIGARRGVELATDVAPWMDGFFHAAAVVTALGDAQWLARLEHAAVVLARLEEGFALARDASRAAARYPGRKALVDALATTPAAAAARFGVPVFDTLERWAAATHDPELREAIEKNLGGSRLAGRFAAEVQNVRAALSSSEAPRRDPRSYVGPTRGRGKKKR